MDHMLSDNIMSVVDDLDTVIKPEIDSDSTIIYDFSDNDPTNKAELSVNIAT